MKLDSVQFLWQDAAAGRGFRTGVCLHGHTLHSKECLSFLPTHLRQVPGLAPVVRFHEKRVDFARAWWTPPLTPASALRLERGQIAALGLAPIVSLTDHDDIEAGVSLQVACDRHETPVSVEWTVPFAGSIFHLGVHNLPSEIERPAMELLADYTQSPSEAKLDAILDAFDRIPDVLTVLNHPFWLEDGVEEPVHRAALDRILARCGRWFHAFELNGTRPWKENRDAVVLAASHRRPVISGGDRHACEPAACINITNAATFSEFAAEIRDGRSEVLFLPHYREPLASRILAAAWEILRPYPEYPDRKDWTDRVFYRTDDGIAQPLSVIWKGKTPWLAHGIRTLVGLTATTGLRSALRWISPDRAGLLHE